MKSVREIAEEWKAQAKAKGEFLGNPSLVCIDTFRKAW